MITACWGCPWDHYGQLTAEGSDHLAPFVVPTDEARSYLQEGWHLTLHLHRKEVT